MAEKKTIWQSLNNILNSEANPMSLEPNKKTASFDDVQQGDKLIKASSKEEFEAKKLEHQQGKFISDQYKQISNDRYQQAVFYETNRYASYIDFEAMEYFPEISAALDIMSEESTCLHDNGKMLNIRSDSERIKKILEHLFYTILNCNVNLPAWTRNTCKYGENFIYLKSEKSKGITACEQLTNIEIKRLEGNIFNNDKKKTSFEWKKGNLEFQTFQVAHFRLIGDDKKLPYGTSVLEKARKIWKMLSLAEDAMMVYRLSRAPERRVFKIDVGNIDDKDVENYVQKIANKFKKTTQVNQQNGQVDLRYNVLSADEDYFIPTRNGQNGTVIDTLPGAQNLSDIEDISFLQNKLFAALRVPKPFLGFAEAAGDGKSLAMQDVRFARTINRIQQAMLMELNKIAIIHLTLLGFQEDWNNFTLTLANPSSQAEMLKLEILGIKLDTYIKAVTDAGNGFSPMSMTKAKKEILGMSEDEIVLDLQQQRLEKAESLRNSPEVLATKQLNSGMFDNLDKRYTDTGETNNNSMENPNGEPPPGGALPSGGSPTIPSSTTSNDLNQDVNGGPDTGLPPIPGENGAEINPEEEPTTIKEDMNFIERNNIIRENIKKSLNNVDKIIKS